MMSESFSSFVEDPESSHVSESDFCCWSSVSNHGDIHVYAFMMHPTSQGCCAQGGFFLKNRRDNEGLTCFSVTIHCPADVSSVNESDCPADYI